MLGKPASGLVPLRKPPPADGVSNGGYVRDAPDPFPAHCLVSGGSRLLSTGTLGYTDGYPNSTAFYYQDVRLPPGRNRITVYQRVAQERAVRLHNQCDRVAQGSNVSQGSDVGFTAGRNRRGAVRLLLLNGPSCCRSFELSL
jgi:hypothetical protein